MPDLVVVDGATLQFEADPGWQWVGWDGKAIVNVSQSIADVSGHAVALEANLLAMGALLADKQYKAMGFEDKPGSVVAAIVQVNASTLSRESSLTDQPVATEQTSGVFSTVCIPSFRIAPPPAPPVPDPMCGARTGRWRVVNAGQTIYQTD